MDKENKEKKNKKTSQVKQNASKKQTPKKAKTANKKKITKEETKTANKTTVKKQTNKKETKEKQIKKEETKQTPKKEEQKQIKQTPKKEEKLINPTVNQDNEMSKLLKIIIIVTIIMAIFYLVTVVVTKKSNEVISSDKTSSETKPKTEIQYDDIIIGSMLTYDGQYYVLIEKDDENKSELDSLASEIKNQTIYKANLTDSFNKPYLSDKNNYDKEDISNFKVTGTTLVKIKDHQITDIYDTYDSIKSELDSLK